MTSWFDPITERCQVCPYYDTFDKLCNATIFTIDKGDCSNKEIIEKGEIPEKIPMVVKEIKEEVK